MSEIIGIPDRTAGHFKNQPKVTPKPVINNSTAKKSSIPIIKMPGLPEKLQQKEQQSKN